MSLKKKRGFTVLAAAATAVTLLASCSSNNPEPNKPDEAKTDGAYVVVVKIAGIGWFDRMEVGVNEWAKTNNIDARQVGAADASPENQVKLVQDVVAQQPKAITVVPNSPQALQTVLKQARDAGIVVVSHEGVGMNNVDADIEAFDNFGYGKTIFEEMAQCMGGEGKYAGFVGQLTAQTHVDWVTGGDQLRQQKYPKITNVLGDTWVEAVENEDTAYNKAKEILQQHPDIKGFQGSASTDVLGIARAVQEAGLQDKICVMGTSIPSLASKYLEDGSIDKIFMWDPKLAGEAQLEVAKILAEGGTITEGTDLKIKGYNSLKKHPDYDNVWLGDATIIVDKNNAGDYNF